jgi:hypothetical protein
MNKRRQQIKELQKLYSWYDFYTQNEKFDQVEKTQQQIDEFKLKTGLK